MSTEPSSVIRVRRLRCDYRIAALRADLEQIRSRLDGVARDGLRQALARLAAPLAPGHEPAVWLIRRLEVPTRVDGGWHPRAIAEQWAGDVLRALERQLDTGADGDNVVYFADRAAYLARFLSDLSGDRAWDCWYYRAFGGLAALPVSAALRTALAVPGGGGMAALQRLAPRDLLRVAASLSATDADRVLDALAADEGFDGLAECFGRAWDGWRDPAAAPIHAAGLGPAQRALALYVRGVPKDGRGTREQARVWRTLAWLAKGVQVRPAQLAAADAQLQEVLAACPPALMGAILDGLAAPVPAGQATRHGGVFLLMPFLDALPLDRARDWPALAGTPAPQVLRLLILAKCQGRARGAAVFADPLLRALLGIAPGAGWVQVRPWLRGLGQRRLRALGAALGPPACEAGLRQLAFPAGLRIRPRWDALLGIAAGQVLRSFALRLPGFAGSLPDYLQRNFLDLGARIEEQRERCVVHLSRPPLQLILNVAGLNRQEYRLSWLGARRFVLCSED